ncbi:MAG: DUF4920 domain-containing protein [Cytophagales bacterium]|nr:DUF4920 domain-containing protein [Cytophagales bacterium]
MKNYLFTLLTFAVLSSCQAPTNSDKEEVQEVPVTYASYGAEMTSDNPSDIMKIDELMQGQDSLEMKLTGSIEKTCKMKGCWMTINTGDSSTMRVTFQDYGFFVPKDSAGGRTAIFKGKAFKSITSVEMLRHFAQDEGKSSEEIKAITEPKEEYTFVATGVLIEEESI